MLAETKQELRALISRNRLKAFFALWEERVDPEADVNHVVMIRKTDYGELKKKEMMGVVRFYDGGVNRNQIVSALLSAVSELEEKDLLLHRTDSPGGSHADGPRRSDELQNMMERKLSALERARILSIDAAEQFRLDEQIRELKEKLGSG